MLDFLFISIFTLQPAFWWYGLRLAKISLLKINIISILMASIFVFQYIGFPILYFELNEYRATVINNKYLIIEVFLWTSATITLLIIGFIFGYKNFGPLLCIHRPKISTNVKGKSKASETLAICILFIIGSLVLFEYINIIGLRNIALLKVVGLVESHLPNEILRSKMGNDFEGKYHWYSFFMHDFLSVSAWAFFYKYLVTRKPIDFLLTILAFLLCSFSLLMAVEKAPFLWFLIGFLTVFILYRFEGNVTIYSIAILLVFTFIIMALMFVYFMGASDLFKGLKNAFSRIVLGQMSGLYHYLEIFPHHVDFLYGASFPNPANIFPWKTYPLAVEVMDIVYPHFSDRGVVGSMPTFFWGEMYANFGYAGIIVPPVLLGLSIYFLNSVLLRIHFSPILVAGYVWVIFHFRLLAGTGLSGFIIDVRTMLFLVLLASLLFFAGNGRIRVVKNVS